MAANTWNGWGGMDDRYLETIPEVDSLKSKRSSISTLPSEGQFRAMPHAVQRLSRPSNLEPTWAHPSASSHKWHQPNDERRCSYTDVSPPSTPRKSWGGSIDETPISPIEPIPPVPKLQSRAPLAEQQLKSQIPRRVPAPLAAKEPTKWDAYSGERTTDGSGVVASIRQGTMPLEQQYPNLKPRTREILASLRARDHERRAVTLPNINTSVPATVLAPSSASSIPRKAPWKGASGRTALVEPVQDTPEARGLLIGSRSPQDSISSEANLHQPRSDAPAIRHVVRSIASQEDIKPVVPLKITKSRTSSPPRELTSPAHSASYPSSEDLRTQSPSPSPPRSTEPITLQSPFHSPQPPKMFEEPLPLSSTRTDSPQQDPSPDTPRTPSPDRYQPVACIPQTSSQMMDSEVSRFSWTTYATSVAESPHSAAHILRNESPPPPIPVMPEIHKRPVPTSTVYNHHLYADADTARAQGSIIVRKPVPVPSLSIPSPDPSRVQKQPLELTTSKTLPQIPPEMEAADKISGLEAQIEAVSRRKHNLNRIIANLKNDLEKNRVNYDMYKRRDVEGQIAGYERELQAAMNDEHDIGLLLHRAVKKRDREDGYELPTGLWIRRVTS